MRTKRGIVTKAAMQGTVTVTVHRSVMHPKYKKRFRVSKKFLADTNGQTLRAGDEVVITECRPISKRKCFRVTEVVKRIAEEATLQLADVDVPAARVHRAPTPPPTIET